MNAPRRSAGQVMTLYAFAVPTLLLAFAFALDGGKLFVARLHLQNAADAAALAAVQQVGPCYSTTPVPPAACDPVVQATVSASVGDFVNQYNSQNNGPAVTLAACTKNWKDADRDWNCYEYPYVKGGGDLTPHWDKVEVRLRRSVTWELGGFAGLPKKSDAWGRSVSTFQPQTSTTVSPGTPDTTLTIVDPGSVLTGQTYTSTDVSSSTTILPGTTHTSTTVTFGNCPPGASDCGVAFAKSTDCPAIRYTGNGGTTIGSLETNGGFQASGNAPKVIQKLYLGKFGTSGCYDNKGVATIDGGKGPIGPFDPQDWPVALPIVPTPVPLSQNTLSGNQCWSITGVGQATNGPGVYCFLGGTLNFSGQTFKGYTWFAQCISVSGNSGDTEYYQNLPAGAGGRQQTLFYASGTDAQCASGNAVTVQGQSNILVGDIFAPNGTIAMQGGGVQSGSGFLESQKLSFAGTFPNYRGTGPQQGGSTTVVTVTDPPTTSTTFVTTTTVHTDGTVTTPGGTSVTTVLGTPPSTQTSTTSTTIGLGE